MRMNRCAVHYTECRTSIRIHADRSERGPCTGVMQLSSHRASRDLIEAKVRANVCDLLAVDVNLECFSKYMEVRKGGERASRALTYVSYMEQM